MTPRKHEVWVVYQGSTLICSEHMRLTKAQALNKVENEARLGHQMRAEALKG